MLKAFASGTTHGPYKPISGIATFSTPFGTPSCSRIFGGTKDCPKGSELFVLTNVFFRE
jgi:hypothetical protein